MKAPAPPAAGPQLFRGWPRGALICIAGAMIVASILYLWFILLSTSRERHTRDRHEFTMALGNVSYGISFVAEADLSEVRVGVALGLDEISVPLTFLLSFQVQVILLLWWRIRLRDPEQRLGKLAKRLFTSTAVAYMLCLVVPTAEDSSNPISGLGLIRYWLAAVFFEFRPEWNDIGDLAENLRFLWLLPVILGPPLLLVVRFLEARLSHRFGIIVGTFLSINVLILATNTLLGTRIEFTYGIVLLGLANASGALAVFTKVVEMKRFDAKWQATLDAAPM